MNPHALRASIVGVLLCSTACASGPQQRSPEAPLAEPSAREAIGTVAAVPWQVLYDRGMSLAAEGDHTRAEQYLAASMRRGGPSARILPPLLRVCAAGQRYRAAVEYARPVLEQQPAAWPLRFAVATIYLGLGEPQSARRELEIVLTQQPAHAEAHFLLGAVLRDQLADPGGADAHFRRYLELAPEGGHAEEARAGLLQSIAR